MDSNHRSLARNSRFLLRKANCGDRTGAAKKGCFSCGTDGSNPSPSSGESGANRTSSSPISAVRPPWLGGGYRLATAIARLLPRFLSLDHWWEVRFLRQRVSELRGLSELEQLEVPIPFPSTGESLAGTRLRRLGGPRMASAVLQPVAEPDRAAFENLTTFERHQAERSSRVGLVLAGIEGVGPAPRAVHRRADREADLVDQA